MMERVTPKAVTLQGRYIPENMAFRGGCINMILKKVALLLTRGLSRCVRHLIFPEQLI